MRLRLLYYVVRRVAVSVVVLFGISFVAFAMAYMLPSDPVTSRFPNITADQRAAVRHHMGLDQPLPVQYLHYVGSVFQGQFGSSFGTGNSVAEDLRERIPATLELAMYGIVFGIALGLPMGVGAALARGRASDYILRTLSLVFQSLPAFWLGVMLIFLLFFKWHVAPAPMGRLPLLADTPPLVTGFLTVDGLLAGRPDIAWLALQQLMLPAFVLGLGIVSPVMRITRSAMGEALQEDYVTFARALGLRPRQVILGDALRGSLVPIVTTIGFIVGNILAGAAVVEVVFSWPGVGRYAVTSITTSDMAPVVTCILLVASAVALTNLAVDLSYALIDPRIRDSFER